MLSALPLIAEFVMRHILVFQLPSVWKRSVKKVLAVAIVSVLAAASLPIGATAEDGLLQQAINYVFTGTTDPQEGPELADRRSCAVVVRDPRYARYIRYYLARFRPDTIRISKKYAGTRTFYELDVESDSVVVEYLDADKTTVRQAYRSAQISLPGTIDQTQKALQIIAERCKTDQPKTPF
jgi:hypothetical protein